MDAVRFVPLTTFIDSTFWDELSRRKLNEWKLDASPKKIIASVCNFDCSRSASRLSLSFDAFANAEINDYNVSAGISIVRGYVLPLNTHEDFKNLDRKFLLTSSAEMIKCAIETGYWLDVPLTLNTFLLTVYADLKNYKYEFWNCIPALLHPINARLASETTQCTNKFLLQIFTYVKKNGNYPFLLVNGEPEPLSSLCGTNALTSNDVHIVLPDPSTKESVPGWPLRNLLAAVAYTRRDWSSAQFICFRSGQVPSITLCIKWNREIDDVSKEAVGWERDSEGCLRPYFVDLSESFDHKRLLEKSVQLNLRLMKWRLVPDLNLHRFTKLKCLILGAGTLGCNIARALLGWGVHNITFVDNGFVSYSNIVRQSLFNIENVNKGRESKADAAVRALRKINPRVVANSECMKIPMPGCENSAKNVEVAGDVNKLEELIIKHDVIFLVLDSREARWLPTLLSAVHQKLAISVALGFDSFLVIRHGVSIMEKEPMDESSLDENRDIIPGSQLGCYFCSDVTAPGNSSVDRAMDQQCTVSRSGISFSASGSAVELLAAVLQHPHMGLSPARISENDESTTVLGSTPHQIRSYFSKFNQITPAVRRFERCVACGTAVRAAYQSGGMNFLSKVFSDPKYLERISGLDQLQNSALSMHLWEFEDNESVSSLSPPLI